MKNTINNGFDSLLHSFEGLKRTKIFYKKMDNYGIISTLKGDKNTVSGFERYQHSQYRLGFKMHSESVAMPMKVLFSYLFIQKTIKYSPSIHCFKYFLFFQKKGIMKTINEFFWIFFRYFLEFELFQ